MQRPRIIQNNLASKKRAKNFTCMGEVGKDVVFARLAVRRWRYNASDSEVAPPGVPHPMVQERLPTLHGSAKFAPTAPWCSLWFMANRLTTTV